MTRKKSLSEIDTEPAAQLADKNRPQIDRPSTPAERAKEQPRGPKGRFAPKQPGGQPGNQNRKTHGQRREKTARGRPRFRDAFDRRGVEYARGVWTSRGYELGSPLQSVLADKKASILRCDDQLAAIPKMHTRTGDLKEVFRARAALARELEALLLQLERMYRPKHEPAAEGPVRHVALFHDGETDRAQILWPVGDEVEAKVLEDEDRITATEAVEAAGIEPTDDAIKSFWVGREYRAPRPPDVSPADPFEDTEERPATPPEVEPEATDTPVENAPQEPAERPADDPAPPTPITPYLSSRAFHSFNEGRGKGGHSRPAPPWERR